MWKSNCAMVKCWTFHSTTQGRSPVKADMLKTHKDKIVAHYQDGILLALSNALASGLKAGETMMC